MLLENLALLIMKNHLPLQFVESLTLSLSFDHNLCSRCPNG
jgi:hypothetical protein